MLLELEAPNKEDGPDIPASPDQCDQHDDKKNDTENKKVDVLNLTPSPLRIPLS